MGASTRSSISCTQRCSTTHNVGGAAVGFQNDTQRRQVESFLLGFDTNLAPAVGQQATLGAADTGAAGARVDILVGRAAAGDCDLIVKGTVSGAARGWVRRADGLFQSDRKSEAPVNDGALRALAGASGQELTYTCMPPGSGERAGIDRDEDGAFDRDEVEAGSDPADPASVPGPVLIGTKSLRLRDQAGDPSKRKVVFTANTKNAPAANRVVPPVLQSPEDPTVGGATLVVYNAAGLTSDVVTIALPASGWTAITARGSLKSYRFTGPSDGPIKRVVVGGDRITVKGGKALFAYTLDEPAQGSVAVQLALGDDRGWCAAAPARNTRSDHAGRFVGAPKTPPPASCPPLSRPPGSPSGAFLDTLAE